MYCSAIAPEFVLRGMNSTRSASRSSLRTTDACEMPTEPSCVTDLTSRGNFRRLGRRTFPGMGKTTKAGTRLRRDETRLAEHEGAQLLRRVEAHRGILW